MIVKFSGIVVWLLLVVNSIYAQLCTGSLGDPIVNITFGQGPNPGGSLPAATTSYQYTSNDCPGDGSYTVRNSTMGCFANTWHTVNADHTGNANGYFMLVNASYQPGAFYLDTVRGLCESTTYEFAAWIMNVLLPTACAGGGNQPDITLAIEKTDGTLLQSYNTGTVPTQPAPTWNQYGSFFTTPAGVTDIVLRIVNQAPGGCGNDLALDDITFRACGPLVSGMIDGLPGYDASYCEGLARQFLLSCTISGGFSIPVFQWQQQNVSNSIWSDIRAATSNTYPASFFTNAPAGVYHFRLAVAESGNINSSSCRVYSQSFTITIIPKPRANAGPDKSIFLGQSVQLSGGISIQGDLFSWSPVLDMDDPHSLQPLVHPSTDQIYTLTVVSGSGCGTASDMMVVKVYKDIYIPSAFSPNADGLNDVWNIPALAAFSSFEVTVYSRWGQPVFQTKNTLRSWDGTSKGIALPNGAYVYYIKTGNSHKLIKGTVVIIR